MRNQRNNNRNTRRVRRTRQEGSTIQAQPFNNVIFSIINVPATGVTNNPFTFANLLPDLSSSARLVKLISITFRFNPINLVTTANNVAVQIIWIDPTTTASVPVSRLAPLSDVNPTILTGRIPNLLTGWQPSTSTSTCVLIRASGTASQTVSVCVDARFAIARDAL